MLTDFLYRQLKPYTSRPATWALRQVFHLHANALGSAFNPRGSTYATTHERAATSRCAHIMDKIGTERLSTLREWMPLEMPETLNTSSLKKFHGELERIQAWENGQKPSAPKL